MSSKKQMDTDSDLDPEGNSIDTQRKVTGLYEVSRDRVALRLQCVIRGALLSVVGLKDAMGRRGEGVGAAR